MNDQQPGFTTIDAYIAQFPADVQAKLQAIRALIRESVPDAEEKISYQMPTFALKGILVHFAAYDNHIGFYPTPSGITAFGEELSRYQHSKGSVRLPLDEPLPLDLIRRIVLFRVEENLTKAANKAKKKPAQ